MAAVAGALVVAPRPFHWFWGGMAVLFAYPKFHIYDSAFLLVDGDRGRKRGLDEGAGGAASLVDGG